MKLPYPVPELPVSDIRAAAKAYGEQMGFATDWIYEDFLAGISIDDARIFLRQRTRQEIEQRSTSCGVTIWLNMNSAAEVDELYTAWKERGVAIAKDLHTAPYNLREFTAEDLDGNRFRVFHDMSGDT